MDVLLLELIPPSLPPSHPPPSLSPVTQSLQFMLEVEDDSDWLNADTLEDDDDTTRLSNWIDRFVTCFT